MSADPYLHVPVPGGVVVFPHPDDPLDVGWALRNGKPTKSELLIAASYIAAYRQLINDNGRSRERKIAFIRRATAAS